MEVLILLLGGVSYESIDLQSAAVLLASDVEYGATRPGEMWIGKIRA